MGVRLLDRAVMSRMENVASGPGWGMSPRRSIERECSRHGKAAVVAGCRALLRGEDVDPELIVALGGPPARWAVTGKPPGPAYWTRVWAARGLLWAWGDAAYPEIVAALCDEVWRVREMAVKVVARHRLGEATSALAALRDDPVQRVANAASRALVRLTAAGA